MKYYKELGYNGKFGDVIHVKVDDIKPTSHIKINTECPICKKEHSVQYCDYYKRQHTLCNSCATTYFNTKNNVCIYCGKKATKIFDKQYYCSKHFEHMKKYGKCLATTCCDLNEISDDNADIDGIFIKDNLQVGIVDENHYKLLNIRDLKDVASNKKPIIVEVSENGCWNCVSHSKHPDGYVYVYSGNKKIKLHKRVLEIKLGRELKVNNDELTRHMCDNPQCCNPDHLIIGNSQENHEDMVSRGRGYWQNNTGYFKWYEREDSRRKKQPKPLLSKDTIINIYKDALQNCIPYRQLDKKYGVGRGVSSNIANKKTYKNITDNIDVIDNRHMLGNTRKEDYIIVKNLKDANLYTNREIADLTGINRETVRNIINDTWIYSSKDIENYHDRFIGDGSGVIYYMDIKYDTIVDGVGFRNTIYCAKCNIHCEGCHNPQSWNIRNGKPITVNKLAKLLLENGNDITFSGGECSLQAKAFTKLAQILRSKSRNIWLYSGYTYEELIRDSVTNKLLDSVDVLVDGRFIDGLKNTNLLFKGSSNQRIIDLNETRKSGEVILWRR